METNYDRPYTWGMESFKKGIRLDQCPIDPRTHANARTAWMQGWEVSRVTGICRGLEIGEGDYSGCDATGGDCPNCKN